MATKITVKTSDVDGSSTRRYSTEAAAVRRFEEMSGLTIAQAMAEQYYSYVDAQKSPPAFADVRVLRAVSNYGTVVTLERFPLMY